MKLYIFLDLDIFEEFVLCKGLCVCCVCVCVCVCVCACVCVCVCVCVCACVCVLCVCVCVCNSWMCLSVHMYNTWRYVVGISSIILWVKL